MLGSLRIFFVVSRLVWLKSFFLFFLRFAEEQVWRTRSSCTQHTYRHVFAFDLPPNQYTNHTQTSQSAYVLGRYRHQQLQSTGFIKCLLYPIFTHHLCLTTWGHLSPLGHVFKRLTPNSSGAASWSVHQHTHIHTHDPLGGFQRSRHCSWFVIRKFNKSLLSAQFPAGVISLEYSTGHKHGTFLPPHYCRITKLSAHSTTFGFVGGFLLLKINGSRSAACTYMPAVWTSCDDRISKNWRDGPNDKRLFFPCILQPTVS